MDHNVLVEEGIEQGRILIDRLQEEPITIVVAAWLRPLESSAWQIYLGAEAPGVDLRREGGGSSSGRYSGWPSRRSGSAPSISEV